MTLTLVPDLDLDLDVTQDPALKVISDAAARMRVCVEWVRGDSRRAVAVEEAVAKCEGVRIVHAYPHDVDPSY